MANSGAAPGSGATGPRGGSYQLTGAPRGSPIPPAALPPPNLPVAGTGGYSGYASHPPYPPQPPPASSNSQGAASSVGYHSSYSIPPSAHIPYPPYAHPPATSSPGFFAPPPPLQAYSTIPPGTSLQTSRVPLSARSFPTNSPTQSQSATTSPRPNTEPENYEIITPQQMAQIQNQIRRYKALAKKYNDMKASLQSSAPPPEAVPAPSNVQTTWQAHHLIAGLGSTVAQEGMIGLNVSDLGPQSKISPHVSPITLPQLLQLREKCFKDSVNSTDSATIKLLALQRSYRSNIIGQNVSLLKASLTQFPLPIPLKTPLTATGPPPTEIRLLPPDQFYRSKKNSKRDLKMTEKDLKRRNKTEKDEGRSLHSKRNHAVFVRDVMSYREEFLRFHKGKYLECSKAARAVKQWIETMEVRKEKKDIKAESRRIQALKENNMEAYIALVQETKNTRLKYLLAQTDEYIATIRNMIRDQRQDASVAVLAGMGQEISATIEGGDKASQLSRQYYHDTHRHSEIVSQPRMLQGGDLKEYQLAGLEWLVSLYNNNLNGILADEMGLGKTIQTLALLAYVLEFKHNHGPFLIVVPLSTLSNWVNEANKWTPTMTKVVYRGPPAVRRQLYKDEIEPGLFNTLFTTYEYIMKDRALLKKIDWQYIIVDEGHRMKNAQSKFAQTLGSLYQSKHRLLLTGTPLQNNLPELWSLLNFLLPSIFNSVDTFDQWFNQPFASFRSSAATSASTEEDGDLSQLSQEERLLIVNRLHEVLRPFMLRRVKDQVLDQLPEKTETVIRCEMSGWQKKLYRLIHQKTLATVKDAVGNVSNVYGSGLNNVIMQLRKVCNHPYLFLASWPVDDDIIRAAGKFELLDRMLPKLKAAGHRVLMFSQMTQCMTILERFFDLKGFPYLRLDGSTTAEEREKRMWMFNDPDSPFFIFLLSTRAGGLGLNLATADTVILFDSDWNPMMDAQAQDRAHRIGQKNEVRVFRLVTNSAMEEKILARATDKRNLTGLVVEAGKFNRTESVDGGDRKAMMEALLKEYSEGMEVEEDGESDEAAVPDDEQINDLMATNETEFALYQRMDKEREARRRLELAANDHTAASFEKSKQPTSNETHHPESADPLPSRLMSVAEVPSWTKTPAAWQSKHHQLLAMSEQVDKNNLQVGDGGIYTVDGDADDEDESNADAASVDGASGGRGMRALTGASPWSASSRKRKTTSGVVYDDGLTETQFMDLVEKSEKEAEDQRRKKSIGRGKKSLDIPVEVPLPDISDDPNALTPEVTKLVLKVISDLIRQKADDGLRLYELFIEKPDKRIFPDYYMVIEKPIALKTIQTNLKKGGVYRLLGDVLADFDLMCSNAKTYNEDTSPVYALCVNLYEEYVRRVNEGLEILRTPKKKKGKKKAASTQEEGGEEEDPAPKKKRSRVSTGASGGKKRGRKPMTPTVEEQSAVVADDDPGEIDEEDGDEEQEESGEDERDEEPVLRITFPSSLLRRGT